MTTQQQRSKEEAAWARIANGLSTASRWDEDPELLKTCRSQIPFSSLIDDDDGIFAPMRYCRPDDSKYEGDDLFLKRLTLWFKMDFMTWVNSPPCSFCGCNENMVSLGTRGPITEEERDGEASRVEVYNCPLCNSETTFPRYNSPRKLLQNRRGRCGEFANLYGLVCRSVGFEVRYILDFTDHVWVEVWSNRQDRWIMADSCEGKIDAPLMYEHGWGKKLSHIFAYYNGDDGCYPYVADVTKRYTRKFYSEEMQSRRAEFCSSEQTLEMMLAQINAGWKASAATTKPAKSAARLQEMERRKKLEDQFLQTSQTRGVQIEANPDECEGRLSGSLAWRASRDELGTLQTSNTKDSEGKSTNVVNTDLSFQRESFLPATRLQYLQLRAICVQKDNIKLPLHKVIVVSTVECAVGDEGLNIVIVDEKNGCILQSRLFISWQNADNFVNTVPDGRIIVMAMIGVMHGEVRSENEKALEMRSLAPKICCRLGGFPPTFDVGSTLAFIGQVGFHPKWAAVAFSSTSTLPGIVRTHLCLEFDGDHTGKNLTLVDDHDVIPRLVFARLSENIMPLNTQLLASDEQKKQAALVAMKADPECVGYVTKPDYPIYLFSASAFPMQPAPTTGGWRTHFYLPPEIAPSTDLKSSNSFEVPVNTEFFCDLFGTNLTSGNKSTSVTIPTQQALNGKRLVALYFSAHWCPPCRQFTPIFAEFYSTLQEVQPEALEVVFVSSDRDRNGFQEYFASMPWLALPFEERFRKESIGSRYGIRGIPALVVIDTISGVVVSQEQARGDIMRGYQMGEKGVIDACNRWLSSIPEESKIILQSIQLSLQEDSKSLAAKDLSVPNPYLVRQIPETMDPPDLIKSYFTALVAQGKNPTAAAAEAIERFAAEQSAQPYFGPLELASSNSTTWETQISLGAVVLPDFKWTDDCQYFCDERKNTLFIPQLTSIRWLVSALTGNIIGVQSEYSDGTKGPCHLLLPEKTEDKWVEHKIENIDNALIAIEGVIKQTGIVLQLPNTEKSESVGLKGGTGRTFSLRLLPGYVLSGLHGIIASTGIIALGLMCKKSNSTSNEILVKEPGKTGTESTVLACAKKALMKNGNNIGIIASLVATAKKYVQNAKKEPFNPKFRTFKLNNKVSDRMAQVCGGIDLLNAMHFSVFCSSAEYLISLNPDLEKIDKAICVVEELLSESVSN